MLNFCPYDFNEYDSENLAYELMFAEDWNWERLLKETPIGIGEQWKTFVATNDLRRCKHYGFREKERHVMLLEGRWDGQKNGLAHFIELLNYQNARLNAYFEDVKASKTEESADDQLLKRTFLKGDMEDLTAGTDQKEFTPEQVNGLVRVYHRNIDGLNVFTEEDGDWIMTAIPCCPHCHAPLPTGWLSSEDYLPIAFMGNPGSGSTSLLLSNYANQWKALKKYYADSSIRISQASVLDSGLYDGIEYMASALCRQRGKSPDSTSADFWACPAFFNVNYKNIQMTVGIYDFSSKLMEHPNPLRNNQIRIWRHMKDVCFMLDYCYSYHELVRDPSVCLNDYEIFAGEVQGKHMDFSGMRLHGVVTKGDLLLGLRDKYPYVFKEISGGEINKDIVLARSQDVQNMLVNENVLDKNHLADFHRFFASLWEEQLGEDEALPFFWHLVSATGCESDNSGNLTGDYHPINPQDPIISAVVMELYHLGTGN